MPDDVQSTANTVVTPFLRPARRNPYRGAVAHARPFAPARVVITYPPEAIGLPVPDLAATAKRAFDIVASALALLLLSPVLLLAALAVACSGRPIFFSQPRVGRHGQTFRCWKFRSMVPDAEAALQSLLDRDPALRAEWVCGQKLRQDPRITRVGTFLRRTSMDELPQLWNVLMGDMSLVGPRPILLNQLDRYGRQARWYTAMRPGITGLWQVTARGDGDFGRRVRLDCDYVRRWSLLSDFVILAKTVLVVLSGRGAM